METAAHILASLVCTKCEQLLKRGPVYQQHDGAAVCGLCQALENAQPASRCLLYEATAQLVRFPCRYREEGCPATVPFVPANCTDFTHEDACEYRQYECSVLNSNHCNWTGRRNQLQQHYQEEHSECILSNPSQITPDICSSQMTNYIIPAFNFLFFLHTRVCVSTAKLHYAVRLLGDPQEASNFSFTVTIQRGKDTITRFRDVLPQELLALQEHSALNFSINGLLSVLDGWDGASLSVEVTTREPQAGPVQRQGAHGTQAESEQGQGAYETQADPEHLQETQVAQAEFQQGQGAHGTQEEPEGQGAHITREPEQEQEAYETQADPEQLQETQVTQTEFQREQGAHGTQAEPEGQGAHETQAESEQGAYETQETQVTQAHGTQAASDQGAHGIQAKPKGQRAHGTQAEPKQKQGVHVTLVKPPEQRLALVAPQRRQAETEQKYCGRCRRSTPRLYKNCGNWLCRSCAPGTMKCSSEGCGFKDIEVKLWIKHCRWFCESRTSCCLCHETCHPDTPWYQHYTTCRKFEFVDSSSFLAGHKNYYLVETAAGHVLCWSEYTSHMFILHVFSPVPCEKLHLYHCKVRLECAGSTQTLTLDAKYNVWWDWEVVCCDKFFADSYQVYVHLEMNEME